MKFTLATRSTLFAILLTAGSVRADFRYSETSKVTGRSIVSMTRTLGAFSKNARSLTDPQTTTTSLKGNRLRVKHCDGHSDGRIEMIDLNAKRFISIDNTKKTYSSMAFAERKAARARAQQHMQVEMAKANAKHPEAGYPQVQCDMQREFGDKN